MNKGLPIYLFCFSTKIHPPLDRKQKYKNNGILEPTY